MKFNGGFSDEQLEWLEEQIKVGDFWWFVQAVGICLFEFMF